MRPEVLRTVTDPTRAALLNERIACAQPYVQEIGREVRAALDVAGIRHTPSAIHAALLDALPGIIAGTAGTLLFRIYEHEDYGEEAFDSGMALALAFYARLVRAVFEEFGPVDEAVLTPVVDRCQEALLVQLQTMVDAIPAAGHA